MVFAMRENQTAQRTGKAMTFDSKYGEKSASGSGATTFRPSKPANISRPQNVRMPPPPKSNKG